jgi:hypothetical protein
MTYRNWLVLFPIGLGLACSSTTPPEVNNSKPHANGVTPSGDEANDVDPNQPASNGPEIQTQGSSLFRGAGTSGAGEALGAEIPPSTAHDCVPVGISAAHPGNGPAEVTCFFDEDDADALSATIERRLEIIDDERWIHLRLTFNPDFVDNSYGETAIGWGEATDPTAQEPLPPDPMAEPPAPPDPLAQDAAAPVPPDPGANKPNKPPKPKKGGHTFKDLVGSDHAEFQLFNTSGDLTMQFKLDYIEESTETASGYACAGVTGGDGKMIIGDADWIMGATSSFDRNLNGCGWGDYLVDSPATDDAYTPNPDAPTWDFRVVYEVWVAEAPFGVDGFGEARIEYVHASPSKDDDDTLIVVPGECPDVPPPVTTTPDAGSPPPIASYPDEPSYPDQSSAPAPVGDAGSDEPVTPRPITR